MNHAARRALTLAGAAMMAACSAPEFKVLDNSDASAGGVGGSGGESGAGGSGGNSGAASDAGAYTPTPKWQASIDQAGDQQAGGVGFRANGGVVVAFHEYPKSIVGVAEFSAVGDLDRNKPYSGNLTGSARVLELSVGLTSGNPLLVGDFTGTSPFGAAVADGTDGMLVATPVGGTIAAYVVGSQEQRVTAVANAFGSNLDGAYVAGHSNSMDFKVNSAAPTGLPDPSACFVSKQFQPSTAAPWSTRVTSKKPLRCNDIALTDSEVVSVGMASGAINGLALETTPTIQTLLVLWFDADGTQKSAFGFGDGGQLEAWAVDTLSDGSIVVGASFNSTLSIDGRTFSPAGANRNAFVIRITRKGTVLWIRPIVDADAIVLNDLKADSSDNIVVVGDAAGSIDFGNGPVAPQLHVGSSNGWVLVLNDAGTPLWSGFFEGSGQVHARKVDVRDDGIAFALDADSAIRLPGVATATAAPTGRDVVLAVYTTSGTDH